MNIRVRCQDAYEAQKLSSLVFLRKDSSTFFAEVLNVVQNEIIISLRDGSAHSVMMEDAAQADALADFLQSVSEGTRRITGMVTEGSAVGITKS